MHTYREIHTREKKYLAFTRNDSYHGGQKLEIGGDLLI